jgi:hypothetical protein
MWVIFGVFTTCNVMCLLDEHTAFIFRVNELVAVMELPANQEANQGSEKYKFSSR